MNVGITRVRLGNGISVEVSVGDSTLSGVPGDTVGDGASVAGVRVMVGNKGIVGEGTC